MNLIEILIIIAIVGILAAVGIGAYKDATAVHIELVKKDWTCTKTRTETTYTLMPVGKVFISEPIVTTVCVNYTRIN